VAISIDVMSIRAISIFNLSRSESRGVEPGGNLIAIRAGERIGTHAFAARIVVVADLDADAVVEFASFARPLSSQKL
jgi:hypothetical protein